MKRSKAHEAIVSKYEARGWQAIEWQSNLTIIERNGKKFTIKGTRVF